MKWALVFLMSVKLVSAGELIVFCPAESAAGDGVAMVYPFADAEFDVEPEMEVMQEGQVIRHTYKDVPAGKYRVRFGALGPIGWVESYMETHVAIAKGETKTIYLFKPQSARPVLPKEIIDGVRAAKKKQPKSWVELEAHYEGASDAFLQYRDLGMQTRPETYIHYLRTDAAYSLKVRPFNGDKPLYAVKFRVKDPEPALDPFQPVGPKKFIIEK